MKLNLGCGNKPWEGFVNVDKADNYTGTKPDVEADISKALPFEDGSADEIHAYHVIEHFDRWDAETILKDWVRVLKPGGILVLELPCLDKIIRLFVHHIERKMAVPQWVLWGLYGDPRYKDRAMCHRWGYSAAELRMLMEGAGLTVEMKEATTHVPVRDMRLEGTKCLSF